MNNRVETFILARSGRLRDGLLALLNAIPQIGSIHQIEGDLTEFQLPDATKPSLLVLDAGMIDPEGWNYMRQAKKQSENWQCRCVVLVENTFQQRMAWMAGADSVLLAGFPAAQFFAIIEEILGQEEAGMDEGIGKNDSTTEQQTAWVDTIA